MVSVQIVDANSWLYPEAWGDARNAGMIRNDGARARVWYQDAGNTWDKSRWLAEAGMSSHDVRRIEVDPMTVAYLEHYGANVLLDAAYRHLGFLDLLLEAAQHGTTDRSKWVIDTPPGEAKRTLDLLKALDQEVADAILTKKHEPEVQRQFYMGANPDKLWWHRIEVGDVFVCVMGKKREVADTDLYGVWCSDGSS